MKIKFIIKYIYICFNYDKKDLIEIRSSGTGTGNNVLTFVVVSEEEVKK